MRIGEYEVTDVTRDTAMIGCQKVTKSQVEDVLKQMNEAKEVITLKAVGGRGTQPGHIYVEDGGTGYVNLKIVGKNGQHWYVLQLSVEGIHRNSACADEILAKEAGREEVVKVNNNR